MKEITREQYLNALELIDKYHRQGIEQYTPTKKVLVRDWLAKHPDISNKIYKALTHDFGVEYKELEGYKVITKYKPFEFMHEVNKRGFMRCKNIGLKCWREYQNILASESA